MSVSEKRNAVLPPDEARQCVELDLLSWTWRRGREERWWVLTGGQGTAGVPLREQLLWEPALWVCSKMVAFNTFQGIISFNKFQLRR